MSKHEPYLLDQFSDLIVTIYSSIDTININHRSKTDINVPFIDWSIYPKDDYEYLKPLHQLAEYANCMMHSYLNNFLIHGSIATNDYVKGWSDLDTLVVISSSTFKSSRNLLKFRETCLKADTFLYQIDPLKHHGLIYCTELDLNQYSEITMPINVIKKSKSLIESKCNFNCYIDKDKSFSTNSFNSRVKTFSNAAGSGIFKHHAKDGIYLQSNLLEHDNVMYQLKYFLGLVMTMPAYFLECRGTPCYKAESFSKVRDLISKESWEIMDACTKIRAEWNNMEGHPFRHQNRVPQWVISYLGEDFLIRAKNLVLELENNLK